MIFTSDFDSDASVMHRQEEVFELVKPVGLQLKVVAKLSLEELGKLCEGHTLGCGGCLLG